MIPIVSMYEFGYELAYTGERKKKESDDFLFVCFLDFCKAELKSEDRFVLTRVMAIYFCLHFDVLSPYLRSQ